MPYILEIFFSQFQTQCKSHNISVFLQTTAHLLQEFRETLLSISLYAHILYTRPQFISEYSSAFTSCDVFNFLFISTHNNSVKSFFGPRVQITVCSVKGNNDNNNNNERAGNRSKRNNTTHSQNTPEHENTSKKNRKYDSASRQTKNKIVRNVIKKKKK